MPKLVTVSESLIELCKRQKEELGITNALIAEKTGVPESTVTKLFNGTIKAPSIETILPIANLLHISIDSLSVIDDSVPEKAPPVVQSMNAVSPIIDQLSKQLTDAYDKQLKLKRENFEKQLKQNSEHYEKQIKIITDSYERHIQGYERILKRKNKWITILTAAIGVIVAALLITTIYDILNPDRGWIQYALEQAARGLDMMKDMFAI